MSRNEQELDLDIYLEPNPQPEPKPPSLMARIGRQLAMLMTNLLCGCRIAMLRRSGMDRLIVSVDQLLLLLVVVFITSVMVSIYTPPGEWWLDEELSLYALGLLASLLAGYLVVKQSGEPSHLLKLLVAAYAVSFPILLVSVLIPWGALEEHLTFGIVLGVAIMVWGILVTFFIPYVLLQRRIVRAVMVTIIWLIASLPAMGVSFTAMNTMLGGMDFEEFDDLAEMEEEIGPKFDAEKVLYDQFYRLDQALQPLKPQQPGVSDLYFVGFGSYSYQDVFMREVNHIQRAVDGHLGTYGRSLLMINNPETVEQQPLASATNLQLTLDYLGETMDVEQDVLMLYLTSHGSKDHELAVDMWPLPLNDLTPEMIRAQLDESGIRWRIILVSACYSGGFIEALKDEHTLVMTAAAHDKTSFGCSDANEYTYFGEALFKEMPAEPYRFIEHFNSAIDVIAKRELEEELEASNPQLYIGSKIEEKLQSLESAIVTYPATRFTPLTETANMIGESSASDG